MNHFCKRIITLTVILLCVMLPVFADESEAAGRACDMTPVPIILYHHIAPEGEPDVVIPYELFRSQLEAIRAAGYNTVTPSQMIAYVDGQGTLPPNPICITFDDGYESNYLLAYPLLKQMHMRAAIFCIGSTFGHDTYKDTGTPIYPHFGIGAAYIMKRSGVIELHSHTYDCHQLETLDTPPIRFSVQRIEGETDEAYRASLDADAKEMDKLMRDVTGHGVTCVSYPHGLHSEESEEVLKANGVRMTLTTDPVGINYLRVGDPSSLYRLHRITVTADMSSEALVALIAAAG